jgi:hypothetical protein
MCLYAYIKVAAFFFKKKTLIDGFLLIRGLDSRPCLQTDIFNK